MSVKGKKLSRKAGEHSSKAVKALQEEDDGSSSDSSGCMHTILQLGSKAGKFLITVMINSVPIEMEVDSGAERSTVPLSTFKQKLQSVCSLQPSSVSLYQYDKSPLSVSGECQAHIRINDRTIQAIFVVVDVKKQFPLLGRDWMSLLHFDVVHLMDKATQVHLNSTDSSSAELVTDFSDVFKDELGVLKGIEATIAVEESALPRFHKPRPVPFALKDKVEQQLQGISI